MLSGVYNFKCLFDFFVAKNIKIKQIEEDDEEEEEEEEDMKAGDDTEDGETEDGDTVTTRNSEKKRSERRRSGDKERTEEQEGDEDHAESVVANEGGFEDMYSRVKRKRTRRSIYDGAMLNRRRQRERKCVQRQGM